MGRGSIKKQNFGYNLIQYILYILFLVNILIANNITDTFFEKSLDSIKANFEMSLVVEDPQLLKKLFEEIETANDKDGAITNQLHFENGRYYLPYSSINSIQLIIESDISQEILFYYNIAWGKEIKNAATEFVEIYLLESREGSFPINDCDILNVQSTTGEVGTRYYNKPGVIFELNDEARIRFGSFTGEHRGRRLAIVFNNIVYMAAYIGERLDVGKILIPGCENQTEAKEITKVLYSLICF